VVNCRHRLIGLSILAAATVALSARQANPIQKPQPTPVYKSGTDLVYSDVVVRDKAGRFIPGLTIKDFEVYEDGVLQTITTFAASLGGRIITGNMPVAAPRAKVSPAEGQRPGAGGIFIIFIDDLHAGPDTPMVKQVLQRSATRCCTRAPGRAREAGIRRLPRRQPGPRHLRFNQAIEKTMGAGLSYNEIISTAQTVEGPSGLRANAFTAFKVAYEILEQAEKITNRRKAFIYVSSGYDFNPFTDSRYRTLQDQYAQPPEQTGGTQGNTAVRNPFETGHLEFSEADLAAALGALVRRARRANVTFNTIDPRGLVAAPPAGTNLSIGEWSQFIATSLSSLDTLALETGGLSISRTNDFKGGLQAIDNDRATTT
jgi:VWFA-related protein